ncbi:DUF3027 domain-containing protein [Kineococcus sp. SYSU DK004]|uniref:DUF3027 domain-containing protein n=1 Tax=Kineococcus sp. SYSU DK004 TaxID=3383125 RepID=UPI003D7DE16F
MTLPGEDTATTPSGTTTARARRARKPALDAAAAGAVDLARAAAEEVADPGTVGEHLGAVAEGDRIVTHTFACALPGYRGWQWSVTVTRASRARNVTVSEVCLLPGEDALRPPTWLPWAERIAPGDVGPHDTLPRKADDPLLDPGYEVVGEQVAASEADELALWELGLGRERVLNRAGRDEAATRWYEGDRGPRSETAEHAKAQCSTCGYFLALAGSMRQVFGVCANEWSPDDARVVSADHGCGAHSETDVEVEAVAPAPPVVDDLDGDLELVRPDEPAEAPEVAGTADVPEVTADTAPGAVTDDAPDDADGGDGR